MKKTLLLCFIFLIIILVIPGKDSYGRKATIPIDINLSMEGDPLVGGDLILILKVRPLIDAPKIRIFFGLPKGIEAISGESLWEGEMSKDTEKTIKIMITIPEEKKYEIYGNASIEFSDKTILGDSKSLTINLGQYEKPTETPPVRKNKRGENIIEFHEKK